MPEGLNTEVAHHLSEKEEDHGHTKESTRIEIVEIVEAILLAIVAIVTAWSGYQAAQWDGKNALYYADSAKDRQLATRQTTRSGQELLYNASTFNSWGAATTSGDSKLAAFFVKRFTPDYRVAFDAWLKTDPAHNPKAPPGPSYMPQYHNPSAAKGQQLDALATATFQKGNDARDNGDKYVRSTVLFATILFIVAISQRFKVRGVRRTMLSVAFVLLVYGAINVLTFPVA
jgi:hypothetical protein